MHLAALALASTCVCAGVYPVAQETDPDDWYRCTGYVVDDYGNQLTVPGYVRSMECEDPLTGDSSLRGGLRSKVRTAVHARTYEGVDRTECAALETDGFLASFAVVPLTCAVTTCTIYAGLGTVEVPVVHATQVPVRYPWTCHFER